MDTRLLGRELEPRRRTTAKARPLGLRRGLSQGSTRLADAALFGRVTYELMEAGWRGPPAAAGRWSGSPNVGSLTFWDGRQPIVGSVGAVWLPAASATSAAASAEEQQQQYHHQQHREQYDDHNHVGFP